MKFRISPAVSLTVLPLLVVLGLISVLYFATGSLISRELAEKTSVRVEARAGILARRMAVAVDSHESQAELLAWTLGQLDLRKKDAIRAQLEQVRRRSQAFVWLGVTDPQGRVLIATEHALEGDSIADRPVFTEGRHQVYFGDFHAPVAMKRYLESIGSEERNLADIGVPVHDAQGRLVAVLVGHLSGNWFATLGHSTVNTTESRRIGLSWYLLPSSGEVMPHALPFDAKALAPADGKARRALGTDGQDYLLALHRVDLGPLASDPHRTVAVTQDVAVATSAARQIKANLGLTALGATLLLGGIAFFASWNTRQSVARILEAAQQGFEAAGGAKAMPYNDYLEALAEQLAGEPAGPQSGDLLRRLAHDAQMFKRVIDHFPLGIAISDTARKVQYLNPAFSAELGWTLAQLRDKRVLDLLTGTQQDAPTPWSCALYSEPPGQWAARFAALRADGQRVPVQWQVIPLFNRHGVFEGILSMAQSRSAELAQQRRAETLAQRLQVFGNAARNHGFVMLDPQGAVLEWNRGAERLMALGRGQALGRPFASLFGKDPAARLLAHNYLARARALGQATLETRMHRADGSDFACAGELYLVEDTPGDDCFALVFSDVTQAQAAALQLAQSEARLNAVVMGASDAVISTDAQGLVLLFNPAAQAIFQVDAEAAIGRSLDWLLPQQPGPAQLRQLLDLSASKPLGTGKVQGLRADGQLIELEASVSRALVNGQRVFTAMLRDVTERTRAERVLLQYQLELSGLAQRLLLQEKETTQRLAQALHDELGQTLAAQRLIYDAGMRQNGATYPAWIAKLDRLITDANLQVRQVLTELRPPLLDEEGLYAALDNEFRQTRSVHESPALLLRWNGQATTERYPSDVEYAAFMVAREAVNNALRHADPETIWVTVQSGSGRLRLEIGDNGRGLDQLSGHNRPGHLGLVGMRERATAINARLEIRSSAEHGTSVCMTWGVPET